MQSTERRAFPHRRGLIIVTTLATAYVASHFFRGEQPYEHIDAVISCPVPAPPGSVKPERKKKLFRF